jgi:hypothetical protein
MSFVKCTITVADVWNLYLALKLLELKGKGHPITDHQGPRGGVEV